jgi:putative transcriptional regulator
VNDGFLTGSLLVASPTLGDDNFERTVVYVVEHDESGALGVIINRPSQVDVAAILPDWHLYATSPQVVFHGGPVGRDNALALACLPAGVAATDADEPVGFRRIYGRVGLVDLDSQPEDVAASVARVRVFAGYAGWEAGQLEEEIAEGAWFVVDSATEDPFQDDPSDLWRDVLRRQPGDLALVATFPADPTLN